MPKEINLFSILNNISNGKKSLVDHEDFKKEYNCFMINRFLAMDNSTVFFANEVSKMSTLPKRMQYEFLFHGINKTKRYFKYAKAAATKTKDVENVAKHFSVNKERAIELLGILSKAQIKEINLIFEDRVKRE